MNGCFLKLLLGTYVFVLILLYQLHILHAILQAAGESGLVLVVVLVSVTQIKNSTLGYFKELIVPANRLIHSKICVRWYPCPSMHHRISLL
jgi:hypothetical protein